MDTPDNTEGDSDGESPSEPEAPPPELLLNMLSKCVSEDALPQPCDGIWFGMGYYHCDETNSRVLGLWQRFLNSQENAQSLLLKAIESDSVKSCLTEFVGHWAVTQRGKDTLQWLQKVQFVSCKLSYIGLPDDLEATLSGQGPSFP